MVDRAGFNQHPRLGRDLDLRRNFREVDRELHCAAFRPRFDQHQAGRQRQEPDARAAQPGAFTTQLD